MSVKPQPFLHYLVLTGLLFMVTLAGCSAAGLSETVKNRQASNSSGLRVNFQSASNEVAAGAAVVLNMRLTNDADVELPFLPLNTAFEQPLQANVFEVVLDGEIQPYLGMKSRRLPIVAEDFLMIDPEQTLEQSIDIAQHYKMDVPGTYVVRYIPKALVLGSELDIEHASIFIDTEKLEIVVR